MGEDEKSLEERVKSISKELRELQRFSSLRQASLQLINKARKASNEASSELLQQALEIDKGIRDKVLELADKWREDGKYELAKSGYQAVLQQNPEDKEAQKSLQKLDDIGSANSRLLAVACNERLLGIGQQKIYLLRNRQDPINDVCIHQGELYEAVDDKILNTLEDEEVSSRYKIFSILSQNGELYDQSIGSRTRIDKFLERAWVDNYKRTKDKTGVYHSKSDEMIINTGVLEPVIMEAHNEEIYVCLGGEWEKTKIVNSQGLVATLHEEIHVTDMISHDGVLYLAQEDKSSGNEDVWIRTLSGDVVKKDGRSASPSSIGVYDDFLAYSIYGFLNNPRPNRSKESQIEFLPLGSKENSTVPEKRKRESCVYNIVSGKNILLDGGQYGLYDTIKEEKLLDGNYRISAVEQVPLDLWNELTRDARIIETTR